MIPAVKRPRFRLQAAWFGAAAGTVVLEAAVLRIVIHRMSVHALAALACASPYSFRL